MKRRSLMWLMVFIALHTFPGVALGESPTQAAKLADFDYLYKMVAENYPYLWVKERVTGTNWLQRRDQFRAWVAASSTDAEFYRTMERVVRALQNDHTHMYRDKVTPPDPSVPSVWIQYVAGDYRVVAAEKPVARRLPIGAKVVAVDGRRVHTYAADQWDRGTLLRDPVRDRLYTRFLPLPTSKETTLTLEGEATTEEAAGERRFKVTIPTRTPPERSERTPPPNAQTAVLREGEVAYLRVRSFETGAMGADGPVIRRFWERVKNYPYLIIDVRSNGGGTDAYWEDLLVAPLIAKRISFPFYVAFRTGLPAQESIKDRLGLGYYFIRRPRSDLANKPATPREVLGRSFSDPILLPRSVAPKSPVGFNGRIFLLVDDGVYSSTESFVAFAKATGWATLVGTQTGGDGLGIGPTFFTLPNSHLIVRMSQTMGINPDGSANEETKTTPDVFVEREPQEYTRLLVETASDRLAPGVPHPELDVQLRRALELIDGEKTPRPPSDSESILFSPVVNMGYGLQAGVQITWPFVYSNFQTRLLWDFGLQQPALFAKHSRYLLHGISMVQSASVQPWRRDDKDRYLFRQEVGLVQQQGERRLSLALRDTPGALVPDDKDRREVVVSASQIARFPHTTTTNLFGAATVAADLRTHDLRSELTAVATRRFLPTTGVQVEWRSGWSSRSDEFTLDGVDGPFSVRGTDLGNRSNGAHRGEFAVYQVLPEPPPTWIHTPLIVAHYDIGQLAGQPGNVWVRTAGIYAKIDVGGPQSGTSLRFGWTRALRPTAGEGTWYSSLSTEL